MGALIEDVTQPLDVSRLGDARVDFNGSLALSWFPRLQAELAEAGGSVQAALCFARELQGRRTLSGTLSTELVLTCQRCLQPLRFPLQTRFHLALVDAGEDAGPLPDQLEAVVVDAERVDVLALLEDELLLCLPIAPRHRSEERCVAPTRHEGSSFSETEVDEKHNPFAVLRDLHVKQSPEKR